MKIKFIFLSIFASLFMVTKVDALQIKDCNVIAIFKQNSSLEEENYICKGINYGKNTDSIVYDSETNVIKLNNFNGYYLSNQDSFNLEITGTNNISLLHIDSKIKVSGTGTLKFKETSYAKLLSNGSFVYRYLYNDKVLLQNDKIYTGTEEEFHDNYISLKEENKIPQNISEEEIIKEFVNDYSKMSSVVLTENWFTSHIDTTLTYQVIDGFGQIKYVEPVQPKEEPEQPVKESPKKKKNTKKDTLETDKVVFITKKAVNSKYTLQVNDIKETEVGDSVSENLEDNKLLTLYDIGVYNGKKEVDMSNGEYTIKLKMDEHLSSYENYKIIYVNSDGDIEEYLEAYEEDGYLIFQTTHLSQYGIIGTQIQENEMFPSSKEINYPFILKISFLLVFTMMSVSLIFFIYMKSKKCKKKRKKRI